MFAILNKIINTISFFRKNEIVSLEEQKQNTLKVMSFAKVHFLSPYKEDGFWPKIERTINGKEYIVHRFNHGLAHSLRQGALAKDIFEKLISLKAKHQQHLDSAELDELVVWAYQKDRDFLYKMEFASSFQRSGRQSEGSSTVDREKYLRYERQDALNFRAAATESGLFKDLAEITIFEEAILWENKGELDESSNPDLKFLRRILHCAHTFDLRRMMSFDGLRIRQDGMKQLLGKKNHQSHHLDLIQQGIWKRAGKYLKVTGDRDLETEGTLDAQFFIQTENPNLLVDAIYQVRKKPIRVLNKNHFKIKFIEIKNKIFSLIF